LKHLSRKVSERNLKKRSQKERKLWRRRRRTLEQELTGKKKEQLQKEPRQQKLAQGDFPPAHPAQNQLTQTRLTQTRSPVSLGLSETGRTPPGRGKAVTERRRRRRRRTSSKLTNSDILILHFEFGTVQYTTF